MFEKNLAEKGLQELSSSDLAKVSGANGPTFTNCWESSQHDEFELELWVIDDN